MNAIPRRMTKEGYDESAKSAADHAAAATVSQDLKALSLEQLEEMADVETDSAKLKQLEDAIFAITG